MKLNYGEKEMSTHDSSSSGTGFLGLLTICFIVLKLTNYISWSWWVVLSPLYVPLVLIVVLLIAAVASKIKSKK